MVLKLKTTASVGSIQPIILKYQSSAPIIPISLISAEQKEEAISILWGRANATIQGSILSSLPNSDTFIYNSASELAQIFTQEQLTQAVDTAIEVINTQMGDQSLARNATITRSCHDTGETLVTNWSLTLGDTGGSSDMLFLWILSLLIASRAFVLRESQK